MRLKIIFRSLLNHLIIRPRSGRLQKKRAKKVNIIYRAPNRRKPITRSFKPARNILADNGINENVGGFSDDDEIKNEETCLCGPGISKGYINIINTAIGCDLKVTIIFVRDML
jgi:hypothetical protein